MKILTSTHLAGRFLLVPVLFLSATSSRAAAVVDDAELARRFVAGLAAVVETPQRQTLHAEQASHQLATTEGQRIRLPQTPALCTLGPEQSLYDSVMPAVVVVGSIYKCGNCSDWHLGGMASGWLLAGEGLVVSNHHVFGEDEKHCFGVMTADGRVFAIESILAADKAGDAVIFRIDTRGEQLPALALGSPANCGAAVTIISHPAGRFYSLTTGVVSRYHRQPPEHGKAKVGQQSTALRRPVWMSVTADYAVGSSGGPVFDETGAVVGMVSRTYSSQADRHHRRFGNLGNQMVFKDCVSLDTLLGLIEPPR
jgi:S1-C subfamily serine protease